MDDSMQASDTPPLPDAPVAAAEAPAPEAPAPDTAFDPKALEEKVVGVLKTVFDPEIPVNIWELGLIYAIEVFRDGRIVVKMTLTAPGCPVAGSLPGEVEAKIRCLPEVSDARVDLVWDPAWNPSMMSEAAKLTLGFNF